MYNTSPAKKKMEQKLEFCQFNQTGIFGRPSLNLHLDLLIFVGTKKKNKPKTIDDLMNHHIPCHRYAFGASQTFLFHLYTDELNVYYFTLARILI